MKKKYNGMYNWFLSNGIKGAELEDRLYKHFKNKHSEKRIKDHEMREILELLKKDFN